ncbi:peptidoglycan recognition family protein [Cronbergia sp. UHCC 0137]|uniref:peptidoglycan recognition protein family protein n=1 Tax=Cronbergia sp. UHCC 0137 TaxID=3110239 RepID=UPI002B1F29B8|nr:peptidoglycan recognition family protein [Cronbergia sp. UHCC 0137]MEA5619895.1 peptidoglycan recognition family protein [Cronbergia sp. UHCC 0137]
MRFRDWATRVLLIFMMLAALILAVLIGGLRQRQTDTSNVINQFNHTTLTTPAKLSSQYPQVRYQSATNTENKVKTIAQSPVKTNPLPTKYVTTQAFANYRPNYQRAVVHPSNYGDRYSQNFNGVSLNNQPIIVLHETSNSASSAINFFQTPHENENVQASYHTLIDLEGTVIYLVPPEKRAYGAANSVFEGTNGLETVQTNPNLPPSVNNFAYHVSLETPPDGRDNNMIQSHSGYTEAQYNSLAWLIAQSQVPDDRITTHRAVDRSGQRADPKSFDFDKFFKLLHSYRQLRPVNTASNQ